jgi:PAS domain S-box-containing protein
MPQKKKTNNAVSTEYLSALENLPVALVIFDNTKVYYLNERAYDILKLPKKTDLKKLKPLTFISLEFQKRIKENNTRILKGEEFPALELKIKNTKGKTIDVEAKSNRIVFNGKQAVQSTFLEISERKKLQEELVESHTLLDLISKNKTDLIFKYDFYPKEGYVYISDSIKTILGYSPEDYYKDREFYLKIIYPGDRNKIPASKRAQIKAKNTSTLARYMKKDGSLSWIQTDYSFLKDKKGKIISMLGICRDITLLKQKEEEVSQKWSNYRELLNQSPMAFFIHKAGICLMTNKAALKILKEKSEKNVLGKFLIKYIVPEQRKRAIERLSEATEGREFDFIKYQIKNAAGKIVDIELKSVPVKFDGEDVVLTLMNDVTMEQVYEKERLRAEIAEEHNKQLIREIENRNSVEAKLQTVFNTSTHIIWTVNTDYELTSFNKNYSDQLSQHYHTRISEGMNFSKLYKEILTKKDFDFWMGKYSEAFKGKNVLFETERKLSDGDAIYREIYLNPTKNKEGKVVEVVAISHNITQRKQNEQRAQEQSAKLKAIFESSSHLVWTVNNKYELTYFNDNFKNVFETKFNIKALFGKSVLELVPEEHRLAYSEMWIPHYEKVLKGAEIIFERKDVGNDGEEIYREIYLNPIKNENGEVFEIACLAHDITENKNNAQRILDQSSRLKAIFESGTQLMWTVNRNICFTSFNSNFYEAIHDLYGVYPEINKDLHRPKTKFASEEYHSFWDGKYESAFAGKTVEFMTERTNIRGQKIFRQIFLHPIYNQDNHVVEVSGMGFDITEKVHNEHKITNQSAKLNAIFNGSSHYIWTVDKKNRLTSFNKNYSDLIKEIYDIYPEEGLALNRGKMIADKEYNYWWDQQYEETLKGSAHNFEISVNDKNNNKIYLEVFLNPVFDKENNVVEVSGIAHNITEKNLNQEKITQSLNEKEVLLKEVHHRVKNNMQVISSILNLQSSYVKDEYALGLLKESQNRIKTMAYIHESLYQNKTFTSINFSEYVSTLTNNILQSYAASVQKVRLALDVQKVILNLDTSIPAGLIINELVTNSIKHAFSAVNDGIILINLYTKNNALFLEVSDNGKGFPKEIDFKNTNSLGLQLVNTLIEQLNGSIELKENKYKGTSFFINFPM